MQNRPSVGDSYGSRGRAAGLAHIGHLVAGGPHYIVLDLDFESPAQATAFLKFLQTKVWSSLKTRPFLLAILETAIPELVES